MGKLRSFGTALIIVAFMLVVSTGCRPLPWRVPPSTGTPTGLEVLVLGPGNGYGIMGHAGLRLGDTVGHFCWVGDHLQLEIMAWSDYLKMYTIYEQRDILGIELPTSIEQNEHIKDRFLAECYQPFSSRPDYKMVSNNCVHGAWALLCELLEGGEEAHPISGFTPGSLGRWCMESFEVTAMRFYPSHRHEMMYRMQQNEEDISGEFFLPTAEADSHIYSSWRLVYTEDLRNGAMLLRPVAGVGNIGAGAAQTLTGIVGLPAGRYRDIYRGLYAMVVAIPELLFYPVRRAGRSAPFDPMEYNEILISWEPQQRTEPAQRRAPDESKEEDEADTAETRLP